MNNVFELWFYAGWLTRTLQQYQIDGFIQPVGMTKEDGWYVQLNGTTQKMSQAELDAFIQGMDVLVKAVVKTLG